MREGIPAALAAEGVGSSSALEEERADTDFETRVLTDRLGRFLERLAARCELPASRTRRMWSEIIRGR